MSISSTREQHEKIVPYSGHNSSPIRSQADWDFEELCLGDGDVDFYGYDGEPDEVSTKPLVYLDFMKPLAGEDEVEKVPVYEEAADTE